MERVERIIRAGSCTVPIFIKCSDQRVLSLARVIPEGTLSRQINCPLLIEPWHVFAQLAEAFLGVTSRLDSLQVNSPSSFLKLFRAAHRAGRVAQVSPLLVLRGAEALLQDDPMVPWTLLQLPLLLPDVPPLRIILISSADIVDFTWVLGDIRPFLVDLTQSSRTDLVDDFAESREGTVTQEQRALIGHLYTLCKDQVADMASFRPFLARLLPLYEGTAFGRKIPLSDTTRLYQVNQKQIAGILSGDPLRSLTQELISSLTPPECILLVASYLCSHNPSKFDLRLFGSTKGRRRARLYNQKTQAGQRTKVSLRALRSAGRAFSLDRLLAIAFFLVPEPVPSLHALYQAITGLVERRLLVRVTLRQLLDTPKYRCILPIDTISMLARSVSLDIDRYMMSTY